MIYKKSAQCLECDGDRAWYEDPREPPVALAKCLCKNCYIDAVNDRVTELQEDIAVVLQEALGQNVQKHELEFYDDGG